MSYSDSDSSSQAADYKNFRQITRERLLYEMLRSAKTGSSKSTWKVLIMDKLTVKIMSYACKMADITQEGVSLVEDIFRRRQPLPSMDAIYFIQPTKENVIMFLSDMSGKSPLYKKAFVFFSSPVSKELVGHIKKDSSVLPRIGALREMNLEFFAIDSQGFITDHERALEDLFGDEETSRKGDACLNVMASRIATVFASLREFPTVRYRAAKSLDASTMTTMRDLIPTKLAAGIWNCLAKHKQSIENFPQTETCELLILDRSIDQIAPIIHEWTYDAMCHDLLNMDGNKYVHVALSSFNCSHIVRVIGLLYEMLRSAKTGSSKSTWKVLIMDKLTVKIMSYACKMADITQEGVSLVEDIFRRRQPLPSMDAIYFIQPTKENVIMFLSDMSGKSPLYKKAFVFFSSPVSKELVGHIKKDSSVLPRIGALREMNLEFFAIDSQGFITDHERALEDLFGDEETSRKGDACLNVMASRIATVFASLREFPTVRYRAAKSLDASTMTTMRDLIPTKLAAGIWNCLAKHKQSIENFPQTETCELLILDRSIDQGFITDHERALEDLFGDEETSRKGDACLNVMASRIATVFASLREFPTVRYRAAKSLDASTMTTMRDLIPTKLAAGIWNCLAKHKQSIENFPQTETCELLILDRSIDQIAPIIHEWTYDAMCHDLLNMDGNKYVHVIPSKSGGQPEKKDVLLEEHDPIWLELRHAHIADASERLHDKMTNFLSKNKAAQLQHGKRDGGELSTRDLQKMVQALPQYSEQIDKLSLHVEIARKINDLIREQGLRELGQLEQDLVFGDAGMKDVIKYLSTQEEASREGKLRLLMILATIYPEKFEGEKGQNLMKLAKLPSDDMSAVNNMRLLGSAVDAKKNTPGGFTLKFDLHKKKRAVRKERQEEAAWQLSRFYPMVEELIEKLSKGELPKEDYPCMNDPSPSFHGSTSLSSSASSNQGQAAQSMRSRRTPTWAKPRGSDDGYSRALEDLFGDEETSRKGDACLNVMASRIATVFASLREFPTVRYRAAKSLDASTMTTMRDLIPTKLAAGIWNCLAKHKQSIENFPQTETCELLILDRSIDQIAPIIHEWTYDAMCHDLLNMDGNKYVHVIPSKSGGQPEKKDVLLEEHDPIWLELRHAHIADASERLHDKMTNFLSKNKAAQLQHGKRDGGELSTRDLQKMVQALPQYSEQIDKLSLHVEIARKINDLIREQGLRELGQLEQDLVFGDAGMKDVIKYLSTQEEASREGKLRLLMILATIYPEKFEGEKGQNLMKLAKLPSDDMSAVNNMRLLGSAVDAKKNTPGGFTLKFDLHKKKRAVRKERQEEAAWQLSRFYPMVEELIEKLSKGELPKEDYPCMNDPSPSFHGSTSLSSSASSNQGQAAQSMRSRRTPTWAKPRGSDDGYSSDSVLRHASSDFRKMGQRIFVFIVGGATRSEDKECFTNVSW
ncbi:hypothetical protein DY000_02057823 [Brassica cretica]|uniref:SNARE-interacting protein KEULE n=1 Tax=Brassica cretica TaxID=69181 RepID=A0ABQ7A724_BRACR|nr:hypothetical protein DY000_02057823 [Brassica cretica]